MAFTVPDSEPEALTAGTTWSWTTAPAAFPAAEGWTLRYALVSSRTAMTIQATTGTSGYSVSVAASATAQYLPGRYQWTAYVTLGGEVRIAGRGYFDVLPNPANPTATDTRSHNRKTLDVLRAALEGRLTEDIQTYQVAGRAVSLIPALELKRLEAVYAARVRAEEHPGELGMGVEFVVRSPR